MELKEQLTAWRKRAGITREQAATKLGVAFTTYRKWELGKNKPSRLAQAAIDKEIAV